MSIEIHNAELERLLAAQLEASGLASVEELLLRVFRRDDATAPDAGDSNEKGLVEFFRESPLVGLELEFERDPDSGRDIVL